MSDDTVGYGKPPEQTRFKPGQSGNPRGRPRKRQRNLLPRQMREDVLRLMEETVVVETPKGRTRMSSTEVFLRSLYRRAVAGNPTAINHWMRLMTLSLQERLASFGAIAMVDQMLDDENRKKIALHKISDPDYDLINAIKDVY